MRQKWTAFALLRFCKMKRISLIGRSVFTEQIGEWPGGWATIIQLTPDPGAPEILFQVRHATAQNPDGCGLWEIGVFEWETVEAAIPGGRPC